MLRSSFFVWLSLIVMIKAEHHENYFHIEENAFAADEQAMWTGKADSILSCSLICARRDDCISANFMENEGSCSLLSTQTRNHDKLSRQKGSFYLEKQQVDLSAASNSLGKTQSSAVSSCQALRSQSPSGVYWIDPDGGSQDNAFKAYCDMDTDGGGWTLVWSYTFTDYIHFTSSSNAVTPRPNWPVGPGVNVPISTTPPLEETDHNAMSFSQWKQLGREFLIKSNVNNWLSCQPGSGSLVDWQEGSISCRIVNHVSDKCKTEPGTVPSNLVMLQYGPVLDTNLQLHGHYYYFEGSSFFHWPTHDPCGINADNYLENVDNPHGNIFVR